MVVLLIQTGPEEKLATGTVPTLTVLVKVAGHPPLITVRETEYVPTGKVTDPGFWPVNEDGLPLGKVHCQDVMEPEGVLPSVKVMVVPQLPAEVKLGTGAAFTITFVVA